MQELQELLGYKFHDLRLLQTALTHSSYANEHKCQSNERLEFVGDSVLGMIVATQLYESFPLLPEGRMTKLRAELVCEQSLWGVADKLGLGERLRLGKGEELTGGRSRHSILADCVEAVIAALYMDGGIAQSKRFIDEHILCRLQEEGAEHSSDYKTELQELIQQKNGQILTYEMTGESGPEHRKLFSASVLLNGSAIGSGEGHTKKEAEQNAAKSALEGLNEQ